MGLTPELYFTGESSEFTDKTFKITMFKKFQFLTQKDIERFFKAKSDVQNGQAVVKITPPPHSSSSSPIKFTAQKEPVYFKPATFNQFPQKQGNFTF